MKTFQYNEEYEKLVKVEKIPVKSAPVVKTKTKVVDGKVLVVQDFSGKYNIFSLIGHIKCQSFTWIKCKTT